MREATTGATAPSSGSQMPSVPVMIGTHFHALDDKGRVIIPAKLRSSFTEQFWMMLDEKDNICLYNYQTGLDVLEYCEQMIANAPEDEELAAAVERITSTAELAKVEGGWRVSIPEILLLYAGLRKDVVTVGLLNHAALWDRDKWEASQVRRLQNADVKRTQAGLMRAAASSIRAKHEEARGDVETQETIEEDVAPAIELAQAAGGNRVARTAAPPAGHGRRGSRVLTFANIGR